MNLISLYWKHSSVYRLTPKRENCSHYIVPLEEVEKKLLQPQPKGDECFESGIAALKFSLQYYLHSHWIPLDFMGSNSITQAASLTYRSGILLYLTCKQLPYVLFSSEARYAQQPSCAAGTFGGKPTHSQTSATSHSRTGAPHGCALLFHRMLFGSILSTGGIKTWQDQASACSVKEAGPKAPVLQALTACAVTCRSAEPFLPPGMLLS